MAEIGRRSEPTEAERNDPLLAEVARAAAAFREARRIKEYPDKWERLNVRNAAIVKASRYGRTLRAIGRSAGMTHRGVRLVIEDYRAGIRYG